MKNIYLNFDKKLCGVTGSDNGQKTFNEQILPVIKLEDFPICIVLPNFIEMVGSSFMESIWAELKKTFGADIVEQVAVISSDATITKELGE